jgi:hypothetical protein
MRGKSEKQEGLSSHKRQWIKNAACLLDLDENGKGLGDIFFFDYGVGGCTGHYRAFKKPWEEFQDVSPASSAQGIGGVGQGPQTRRKTYGEPPGFCVAAAPRKAQSSANRRFAGDAPLFFPPICYL